MSYLLCLAVGFVLGAFVVLVLFSDWIKIRM